MQELPFLRSARRLMLIDICMKFREDSFRGFQVIERTRFVTDRQTDRRTDRRTDGQTPGEKQYVSQPFGGRHNYKFGMETRKANSCAANFEVSFFRVSVTRAQHSLV